MTLGVAAGQTREHEPLVGRADELDALERVLDELSKARRCDRVGGRARYRQDAAAAGTRGSCGAARAPRPLGVGVGARARAAVSVFVDALDEYVESLDPNLLSTFDDDVQAELARLALAVCARSRSRGGAPARALPQPPSGARAARVSGADEAAGLVLDDFHWADPGSVELLGALLRRPPGGRAHGSALRPSKLRSVLRPPSSGRVVRRC